MKNINFIFLFFLFVFFSCKQNTEFEKLANKYNFRTRETKLLVIAPIFGCSKCAETVQNLHLKNLDNAAIQFIYTGPGKRILEKKLGNSIQNSHYDLQCESSLISKIDPYKVVIYCKINEEVLQKKVLFPNNINSIFSIADSLN